MLWPEVWSNMWKSSETNKSGRATDSPKLDNARSLRGICYIDLDDMKFKNSMKNARRKLEVPLESTMLGISHSAT